MFFGCETLKIDTFHNALYLGDEVFLLKVMGLVQQVRRGPAYFALIQFLVCREKAPIREKFVFDAFFYPSDIFYLFDLVLHM